MSIVIWVIVGLIVYIAIVAKICAVFRRNRDALDDPPYSYIPAMGKMMAVFTFVYKRGTPFSEYRKRIYETVQSEFPQLQINYDTICFTADLPCGCMEPIDFKIHEIPFEDLHCRCGKTKIFEFKEVD